MLLSKVALPAGDGSPWVPTSWWPAKMPTALVLGPTKVALPFLARPL